MHTFTRCQPVIKQFLFSLIVIIGTMNNAFSQDTAVHKKQLLPQTYLSKSTDQLIGASILLGAGTVLFFVGKNTQNHATGFDFSGGIIATVGVLAAGGSIPLFIGAVYNHQKGKKLSVSIKPENALSLKQLKVYCRSFPALSVKINF